MSYNSWVELLNGPAAIASGSALNTSTTLTDISPAPQIVVPANYLYAGRRIRVRAKGVFGTTGTPTLLIGLYYGGVAGAVLAATAATTTASGVTNVPWALDWEGVVRSIGAAGTIWGMGYVDLGTSATAMTHIPIPNATPQTAVGSLDTTTAKAWTIGAQWGTSNASNTITCHDYGIETLN